MPSDEMVEKAGYRILRLPDGTETRLYVGSVHINWQTGKRTWIPPDDGLPYMLDEPKPHPHAEDR